MGLRDITGLGRVVTDIAGIGRAVTGTDGTSRLTNRLSTIDRYDLLLGSIPVAFAAAYSRL